MSNEIDPREYGRMEARVQHLEELVRQMSADIKAMRDLLEQSRGGWKVMMWFGGMAASAGGLVSWFLSTWQNK